MEENLGKDGIKDVHIHISGIEFGNGGEKNHTVITSYSIHYTKLYDCKTDDVIEIQHK